MTESRRAAWLAAACAGATVFVFFPAVHYPFLNWDDGVNVASNGNLSFRASGLWWMLTGSSLGHWHPLTWLTLALDRAVWGNVPFGYHLTNVLLHALNAALLFLLARRLLKPAADAETAAVAAALLWALHPLRVESVAWITERRDVLSGALILASALAYVRGAEAGENPRGRRLRLYAFGLGAAAMAAKVFAVVLPAVFLALDARLRGRPRWKEKIPWLIPAGLALAFNLAAQARSAAAVSVAEFGLKARLAQAAYGLSFYFQKSVWPTGLGPLYERSPLLEPAPFAAAAAAVLAVAAAIWFWRKRFPWLAQGALVYFLFALPALGLFKSGRMTAADRYSYLPAIPLALLAGAAFARAKPLSPLRALVLAALFILPGLTGRQLPVWGSDVALWNRACYVSPYSYFARLKLASAEAAAGDAASASADRLAAANVHANVFNRAAEIYAARGDQAAAQAAREQAQRGLQIVVP